ncbi:TM2 domain-containing protein [Succinivibrio sp.]|uniref:TM2 domain-containing protein n=1 Tax=Succinivibrio sp. TaxID=2053619 RepID=UPI0025856DC4|nr:TM2 domain-containing protein [Succinivibrio sp.]MDD6205216.1 TM2 domain-containing protein [Succinivibrio sp.]
MAKIIKIEGSTVTIGMDDGTIKEVNTVDCSGFTPAVGIEVDVFSAENKVIVSKKAVPLTANAPHSVNKVGYVLLAFFLGGIGIHKFYAGHILLGFIYLIFCWTFIPGFIAFIEFIIGLCKTADEKGNIQV